MSDTLTQTLVCRVGGHEWNRPAERGRPPHTCPEHRLYGEKKDQGEKKPEQKKTPDTQEKRRDIPKPPTKAKDGQHESFPLLLNLLGRSRNVYAFGASGSGKTEGARRAAAALFGEKWENGFFWEKPCHPLMNSEDLDGFNGPHGYVPGVVRRWLENPDGGILLLDEMDAANPALLVSINMITALNVGQSYLFPDGVRLTRTANHVIVGAGNTNGLGATADYTGRAALDRATLTRFAFLPWGYDERLEMSVVGTDEIGIGWVTTVQAVRRICKEQGISLMVTPRSSIFGADDLRAGLKEKDVMEMYVFQGCDDDTKRTVRNALKAMQKETPAPEQSDGPALGSDNPDSKHRCCGNVTVWYGTEYGCKDVAPENVKEAIQARA